MNSNQTGIELPLLLCGATQQLVDVHYLVLLIARAAYTKNQINQSAPVTRHLDHHIVPPHPAQQAQTKCRTERRLALPALHRRPRRSARGLANEASSFARQSTTVQDRSLG